MVRLLSGLAYLALATNTISAASLPDSNDALSANILPDHAPRAAEVVAPEHTLQRRKGGGGRGGGSSSGGSSSGGGRSGGGSSSSGRTSGSSMAGGRTSTGSGPKPAYGRGAYYGGGAAVPYSAGSRTPKGLIAAPLLVGGAALAIMPGLWLYSVYPYHYNNPYRFYNRTANRTNNNDNDNDRRSLVYLVTRQEQGANETLPVVCLCQEFSPCGCDENDDPAYISDLVGNGSYAALNKSLITVSDVNNTRSLVLNGTLPNGTTAAGGEDDDSAAAHSMAKYTGYWAMGLVVLYGVML
ncbi:hypothetical protein HBH98_226130 [Parastagonospora nodorum]|nr:hypothetical protein HBH49_156620 [Parastagonospora nodorum]KAH4105357.1 hypothetical protein HBH46_089500 [Parastagonospora nodorum]KAH4297149.1 hypothetical protein HBI01_144060 [Parastagonospora nodorum]KAH4301600.1 hypothetical protein HBI02_145950 [Parastagonospora nodorum]KAH4328104.1 hypothetical protein HBI00_119410 [Parastagonospora nodorum]